MKAFSVCCLGENTPMGVTGFSMGIASSTASGLLECSTPSRKHLPCADGERGNMPLLSSIGQCGTGLLFLI